MRSRAERATLLAVARETIVAALEHRRAVPVESDAVTEALIEPRASLVTLRRHGELAGCIGSLEPVRPLIVDVSLNAFAAAFEDPRLRSVTMADLPVLEIEISVLGPMRPMTADSVDDLVARVRPSEDGLLVTAGGRRGTFLPSVWDTLPDAADFVAHLWAKAGRAPGTWPQGIGLWRYSTLEFDEAATLVAAPHDRTGGSSGEVTA